MADAVVRVLEEEARSGGVTLIVSGDPGFYSLAKKVTGHFGRQNVRIIPGISSLQLLASRLGRSWVGVACLTVHGRELPDIADIAEKLRLSPALVVLFGSREEVLERMRWLASDGELASARAALGWDLGLPEERLIEASNLTELSVNPYVGRLALLWLEKKEEMGDAGE
jgi:precorrin-6B methylase 1